MIYIAVLRDCEITAEPLLYNTPLVRWTHAWQPHNWRVSIVITSWVLSQIRQSTKSRIRQTN